MPNSEKKQLSILENMSIKNQRRAGESAQQLTVLVALAKRTQVHFLAPVWQLTYVCNSSPSGYNAVFLHAIKTLINTEYKMSKFFVFKKNKRNTVVCTLIIMST